MSFTAKSMRKFSLLGALVLATALSTQAAQATATPVESSRPGAA